MKLCTFRPMVLASVSLLAAAMPFGAYAQAPAKPAAKKPSAVLRAASELKWENVPNAQGAQRAVVWGNPQKGAHGSFAKFAAGTEVPLHTHTAAGRSVVISGTMREGLEGQEPKELGPGSYFYIPGEVKHTTACKAGAECLIYTDWSAAFDLKPVNP
jgi:quercetin dioxygenase-like cupin family protein